jgi:hypothetical protein
MDKSVDKLKIDHKFINKTKCYNGFSCLNSNQTCCSITEYIADILFIKKNCDCHHRIPFGSDSFCACPVRKEIFRLR